MRKARSFEKSNMARDEFNQFEKDVQVKLDTEETEQTLKAIFNRCPENSYTKKVINYLLNKLFIKRIVFTFDASYTDNCINIGLTDGLIRFNDDYGWGVLEAHNITYEELIGKDAAKTLLPAILKRYDELMVCLPIHTNSGIYDICSKVYNKLQGNGIVIPLTNKR